MKEIKLKSNKGADFINIKDLGNSMIEIKTGSCCIMTFHCIMPVELLTVALSHLRNELGNPVQIAQKLFLDNPKWKDEVVLKTKGVGLFGNLFDYRPEEEEQK